MSREYFAELILKVLLIDMSIYLVFMVALAIYSAKNSWEPKRIKKWAFRLTLQLVILMGVAFSLLMPWSLMLAWIGLVFLMFVFNSKAVDWQRRNLERAFGHQYWKKPGTRGRLFPFLVYGKIKKLNKYTQQIELDPNDAQALHNKGSILKELGEKQEAEKCFDAAQVLDPTLIRENV